MDKGFQVGRVFGIKVNIDWSWLLIFLLVSWNLTVSFGNLHPAWGLFMQISVAVTAALLFFGSVLAHELAHSLMARAQGVPVRNITLFLFGGISNIQREPPSPRAEFLITIVGPITSIVLGVLFILLASLLGTVSVAATIHDPAEIIARLDRFTTLLLWLGPVNLLLGVFNLIPGFPLDGGRVLRSILWAVSNNLRWATRWAARVGRGIAWLFVVVGVAMIFGVQVPILGSGFISGLWLAFIGWFLSSASEQSYRQVVIQDILEGVAVERMMRTHPPTVSPDISVNALVHEVVLHAEEHAFPVEENGRLVGMVTLQDIRGTARETWDRTTVREIMTPLAELITVRLGEDAAEALSKLQQQDVGQLPVMQNGHLAGLLRRQDIIKWLQLQADVKGL